MNLFAALVFVLPAVQDRDAVELRGVWMKPVCFDSSARRKSVLGKIRKANLNTVFLAVPPVEGNYGSCKRGDFEAVLKEAGDLSVHAWLLNHHRKGWGKGVDFTDPGERDAQMKWALALLGAYPSLDGIHFDYIRDSEWAAVDGSKMKGVTETIRITREGMRKRHPGRFLTASCFIAASAAYQGSKAGGWEGAVPEWYRTWYRERADNWYIRRGKEQKELREDWLLGPLCFNYQQNPHTWLHEAGIDGVIPMQYTSVDRIWQAEVDLWKSFLGERSDRLYPGLGWLTEEGHPDWKYDAAALVRFIRHGRARGMKGFVIFTLGVPDVDDAPLIEALSRNGPFGKPARSPLRRAR